MLAFVNTTNFSLHTRRMDVSYDKNMAAGPSCQPQYSDDMGRRGSYDDREEEEESEFDLAKKRECASRVAAWINQSAVRITAVRINVLPLPRTAAESTEQITTSYGASSTTSFDLDLDLDLDLEDQSYDSDFRDTPEGEPYLFYSSSSSKSVGAPIIHAPIPRRLSPRRSSRGRSGRRHHGHSHRPRMPSPLYVIHEEDSE
ncbi:hypothetical protein C8F04DRAFT_54845 [Mycena alexandri]|uniref:Uncharacterized protein n=1 Tax=Mycena alexandri TaxID=1745969 RepID=A0AAD6TF53_9AGAR|nr:hypothetical protein C8F04DRAFT_54845 [Mycena alexandri]